MKHRDHIITLLSSVIPHVVKASPGLILVAIVALLVIGCATRGNWEMSTTGSWEPKVQPTSQATP